MKCVYACLWDIWTQRRESGNVEKAANFSKAAASAARRESFYYISNADYIHTTYGLGCGWLIYGEELISSSLALWRVYRTSAGAEGQKTKFSHQQKLQS